MGLGNFGLTFPVSSEADATVCALPLFIPSGRFALPLSAAEWGVMQEMVPHPHEVIQPRNASR